MKTFVFTCFWAMCSYIVQAQKSSIIRIKDGEVPNKVVPFNKRYRYEQFRPGSLTYLNGNKATANFNYNVLIGEMQMIAPAKDTLSLSNEQAIKLIVVGEDVYYYNPKYGYLEVVASYAPLQLALNQKYKILGMEKLSGYNQTTTTASITNINSFAGNNGQVSKLASKGTMVLSRENLYYIIDQNRQVHLANRGTFMKLFARHKKELNTYLKEKRVDYNNAEDLKRLVKFCSGLL